MPDFAQHRPYSVSSFVGRLHELEQLTAIFEHARLVTLTGPGGTGKTRLAIEFSATWFERTSEQEHALFVDLSGVSELSGFFAALASNLDLDLAGLPNDDHLSQAIATRLRNQGCALLVVDNFEPLVGIAGRFLKEWLEHAPALRVLVTSRNVLGLDGEHVLVLPPLDLDHAVSLFLSRCEQVRPRKSQPNPSVLAEIVEAIDCMPLAIELAASRTHFLTFEDLHRRLKAPLDVLRAPNKKERHSSMRRVILDSVELLRPEEQQLFQQLAVFRNGFAASDAEAVLRDNTSVLTGIETLVRASLLQVDADTSGCARYRYFETVREVAQERASSDEQWNKILLAHSTHYARAASWGEHDLDNLLLAHSTAVALAKHDPTHAESAAHLALNLESYLSARGMAFLRSRVFDQSIQSLEASASNNLSLVARVHLGRGKALRSIGDTAAAQRDFERSLSHAADVDERFVVAVALTELGGIDDVQGDTKRARRRLQDALQLFQDNGDESGDAARAFLLLGHTYRREGQLEEARPPVLEAVSRYRRLGDSEGIALAMHELGVVELFAGARDQARACFEEGLRTAKESNIPVMVGAMENALGCLLQEEGHLQTALHRHALAARTFGEYGYRYRQASALFYLATTYVELGELREALEALEQSRERIALVGSPRYEALQSSCFASTLAMLDRLSEAGAELRRAQEALSQVRREPALAAAVSIHELVVEVCAGKRELSEAIPIANGLARRTPNDDTRFAERALALLAQDSRRTSMYAALVVGRDGRTFSLPQTDAKVELPEGSPLCAILLRLVEYRHRSAGVALTIEDVVAAGWPGEKIATSAARNRAYVAIATLRKKGLRDLIVRASGGYALSQAAVVRWATD